MPAMLPRLTPPSKRASLDEVDTFDEPEGRSAGAGRFSPRSRNQYGEDAGDEGFGEDRALGYTCDPALSIPGAHRGLRDIAAAMEATLSVAYAGEHPGRIKGVVNVVGGWMGSGCQTASRINQEIFRLGGHYPGKMLWLYGDRDPFYPLSHSRDNFAAFKSAD